MQEPTPASQRLNERRISRAGAAKPSQTRTSSVQPPRVTHLFRRSHSKATK
jgi:hypothetical protein